METKLGGNIRRNMLWNPESRKVMLVGFECSEILKRVAKLYRRYRLISDLKIYNIVFCRLSLILRINNRQD